MNRRLIALAALATMAAPALSACSGEGGRAMRDSALRRDTAAPAPPPGEAPDSDSLSALVAVFEFAEAGAGDTIPVPMAASDSESVADINQGAELLGSAGPLVFIKTWTWTYSCGAHGNTLADFVVLDLAQRAPASVLSDSARFDIVARHRETAFTLFKADTTVAAEMPDSLWLTMIVPRLGNAPRASFQYQFTGDACYACGDGRWSSYTRSVLLPAGDTLPPVLAAAAEIPAEVRTAFRTLAPDSGAGWSEIVMPVARRDALARLFGVTAPAGGREFLVWRRVSGAFQSAWLRGRGVEATLVGRAEGVWIVAGGRAWNWRRRLVRIPTTPCNPIMADPEH